jgi:hypothetical protein
MELFKATNVISATREPSKKSKVKSIFLIFLFKD